MARHISSEQMDQSAAKKCKSQHAPRCCVRHSICSLSSLSWLNVSHKIILSKICLRLEYQSFDGSIRKYLLDNLNISHLMGVLESTYWINNYEHL